MGDESATGSAKSLNSRETTTPSQRPTLTIEYTLPSTPPAADFDDDLSVGFADFFLFVDHFGQTPAPTGWDPLFDLYADGRIGMDDFFLFVDHLGE
ncbi:MAG: hypothetical protein FJY95_00610 [Candidatus Handelsmanbacteria bacterium]|nr:hypothetical protein [Candidatus Handelsmanbacteria bacterium]